MRYKKHSMWYPFFINATFSNGKRICVPFAESDFAYVFHRCPKPYCFHCGFKGTKHVSDVSIGDEWSLERKNTSYNKHGVSAFIIHNEKGKKLLDLIDKQNFFVKERDVNSMVSKNTHYFNLPTKYVNYDSLVEAIKRKGLHEAVIDDCGKIQYFFQRKLLFNHYIKKILPKKIKLGIMNILNRRDYKS